MSAQTRCILQTHFVPLLLVCPLLGAQVFILNNLLYLYQTYPPLIVGDFSNRTVITSEHRLVGLEHLIEMNRKP